MKYSIVMSVYEKDRPEWLVQALESLINQTLVSDDIIIVIDGPIMVELDTVLERYNKMSNISLIRIVTNMGLGNALNVGIKQAKYELIARMDSDDIAVLNRFEIQIAEFKNNPKLSILGGQIAEFMDEPTKILSYRKVPTTYSEIKQFARRRNPFNHPTVMYKKSVISKLGYYDVTAIRIEDYDLWLRALSQDLECTNLDVVLLNYRSTPEAMKRRRTFVSWKNHIAARTRFYTKKYISLSDLIYGVATQTVLFILPETLANMIFKRVVRNV
jgi:glycosyltransferase involved in cell wall biosynthesis